MNPSGFGKPAAPTTYTRTPTGISFAEQPFLLPIVLPTTVAWPGGEFIVQEFKRKLIHPALRTAAGARLLCPNLSGVIGMLPAEEIHGSPPSVPPSTPGIIK